MAELLWWRRCRYLGTHHLALEGDLDIRLDRHHEVFGLALALLVTKRARLKYCNQRIVLRLYAARSDGNIATVTAASPTLSTTDHLPTKSVILLETGLPGNKHDSATASDRYAGTSSITCWERGRHEFTVSNAAGSAIHCQYCTRYVDNNHSSTTSNFNIIVNSPTPVGSTSANAQVLGSASASTTPAPLTTGNTAATPAGTTVGTTVTIPPKNTRNRPLVWQYIRQQGRKILPLTFKLIAGAIAIIVSIWGLKLTYWSADQQLKQSCMNDKV